MWLYIFESLNDSEFIFFQSFYSIFSSSKSFFTMTNVKLFKLAPKCANIYIFLMRINCKREFK